MWITLPSRRRRSTSRLMKVSPASSRRRSSSDSARASSGTDGLEAVLAAIDQGKSIALANKEILVMAGALFLPKARRFPALMLGLVAVVIFGFIYRPAYFLGANRGKKSVTLDISKPEGQQVARRLAARASTLIASYSSSARTSCHFSACGSSWRVESWRPPPRRPRRASLRR